MHARSRRLHPAVVQHPADGGLHSGRSPLSVRGDVFPPNMTAESGNFLDSVTIGRIRIGHIQLERPVRFAINTQRRYLQSCKDQPGCADHSGIAFRGCVVATLSTVLIRACVSNSASRMRSASRATTLRPVLTSRSSVRAVTLRSCIQDRTHTDG